jgi:hypothetical protein
MQWPDGSYAVLKPQTGCPSDVPSVWSEGSRKHYGAGRNLFSKVLSLAGNYTEEFMQHDFCNHGMVTNNEILPRYKTYWEPGSYCIFRRNGTCPRGTVLIRFRSCMTMAWSRYSKQFSKSLITDLVYNNCISDDMCLTNLETVSLVTVFNGFYIYQLNDLVLHISASVLMLYQFANITYWFKYFFNCVIVFN